MVLAQGSQSVKQSGLTNIKNGGFTKPDKSVTRKEKYRPMSLISIDEKDLKTRLAN